MRIKVTASRIKHRNRGHYEIRRAPGVQSRLEAEATRIATAANNALGEPDQYRTSSMQGRRRPYGRWRTTVITATWKAKYYEAKTNFLSRKLRG